MPSAMVEINTDTGGLSFSGKYARYENTNPSSAITSMTAGSSNTPGKGSKLNRAIVT